MYSFKKLQLFFDALCRCNGDNFPDNIRLIYQLKKHVNINPYEEKALELLSLREPANICRLIRSIKSSELEHLIRNPEYISYKIPKKKGGWREIQAPDRLLKRTQQRINYFLQCYYCCIKPDCVYGFVMKPDARQPYCNIVKNAEPHVNKRFVLNIDLLDFFPNITAKRVLNLFRSELFGFNEETAITLALLVTYQGKLPAGAPTSPAISNFLCFSMDKELIDFCQSHQLTYTRYADDLTFSSDISIGRDVISEIIQLIRKHDFRINKRKFRLQSSFTQQTVTGIVVNKKINIDRKKLKKIRAMQHDLKCNGIEHAAAKHFQVDYADAELQDRFFNRLTGYVNFVKQVNLTKSPLLRE
jgi:RNA-directed DNA polymerase